MFCRKLKKRFCLERQARRIQPEISTAETASSQQTESEIEGKCDGVMHSNLISVGRKSFDSLFRSCEKLRLVPFTRLPSGQVVKHDLKNRLVHFLVLTVLLCSGFHKLWGVACIISSQDEFDVEGFVCVVLFGIYFASFFASLSLTGNSEASTDLLNSWPHILSCIEGSRTEKGKTSVSPFDESSMAMKLISALCMAVAIPCVASFGSFVYPDLPVYWLPTLERLGILQDAIIPRLWLQLISYPLEVITYFCPVALGCLGGQTAYLTLGVFRTFLKKLG